MNEILGPDVEALRGQAWHALSGAEALRALESGEAGLTTAEAAARRQRFGPNVLPRAKRRGPFLVYLLQFKNPLIYLLLAAAAISLIIGELTDAVFIFGVLQLNALISTFQEWRAQAHAEALGRLVQNATVVRRDDGRRALATTELVAGDVVELESGAQVPADVRLLSGRELEIDQSLLTGESLPVFKQPDAVLAPETAVAEQSNSLHAGTTLLHGRATGVVIRTGAETEIGRIAKALASAEGAPPPLVQRLERFTRAIGVVMVGVIALIAVAELMRGTSVVEIFFVAVALAVAAIPEGLPVAITVALAIGTTRMARRNVIVRALPAVEGLGACTLIASDKTGTLTENALVVRWLALPADGDFEVAGEGYAPEGKVTCGGKEPAADQQAALARLATAGALCNEASIRRTEEGFQPIGDTVDAALLVLAGKVDLDRDALLARYPRTEAIPYEPQRRYAASFHRDGARLVCFVKGAAETVLPMCRADDDPVLMEAERLAGAGYRVLAVAGGEVDAADGALPEALRELEFLGLVGLIDPLRPEAPEAVRLCKAAGIDVRMVTGDHPATALAIARDLGIATAPSEVVTGAELGHGEAADGDGARDARIAEARVFARVEPLQKLVIVRSLRRAGHVVAVTGDGANDAPALQDADIGVAMGRAGTDVARDAADLILADDNFASIVNGVEEGRVAYDNVRKVIWLLVSTGAAEIMLFFFAILAGVPLPLFAAQLLWLNVVTQSIQIAPLTFERGEPGVLQRWPRPPNQPIFDRRMIEQTAISGIYMGVAGFAFYYFHLQQGWSEAEARNALLLLMVLFENVHIFNCRSERRSVFRVPLAANPWLVFAVVTCQGAHLATMYLPGFLQDVLGTRPIDLRTWLTVTAIALSLIVVVEIYKWLRVPKLETRGRT